MKVSIRGIDSVIRRINGTGGGITEKTKQLIEKLAKIGLNVASVKFSEAQYDGTNDVEVSVEWDGDNHCIIHADGNAVAFIEFGTGVHYTESHPDANRFGAIRGGFGYGLGKFDKWRYRGDPGTHGDLQDDPTLPHFGWVVTYGNPPARAMYDAGKEIRNKIEETVKEVFR